MADAGEQFVNEEALFNAIDKLKEVKKLQKEMDDNFFIYERPRQTWQSSKKNINQKDLRYKVDHEQAIVEDDIEHVKEVIKGSCGESNKFIFPYTSSLKMIQKMDKELASDQTSSGEKNEYLKQKKEFANDITKYFWGDGNFIQNLAKNYLEEHYRKLFELLPKCDPENYKDMLKSKLENKSFWRKLDSKKLQIHRDKISALIGAVVEAYGYGSAYEKELGDINFAYAEMM